MQLNVLNSLFDSEFEIITSNDAREEPVKIQFKGEAKLVERFKTYLNKDTHLDMYGHIVNPDYLNNQALITIISASTDYKLLNIKPVLPKSKIGKNVVT